MTLCRRKPNSLLIAIAVAIASTVSSQADAAVTKFQDLSVDVVGEGTPVLMIPGLNSGMETWRETCQALQADHVQCHLVQLPGFAGAPGVKTDAFLPAMRDELLAYVEAKKLRHPVVMGHSLGGTLALEMAAKAPTRFDRLVIVDALPYFMAARDPSATVGKMAPVLKQMEAGMRASDDATYFAQATASAPTMAHGEDRIATLRDWGRASDRNTTTQAMIELMSTDLRGEVAKVKVPTLVLGSWAAYKPMGSTLESTRGIFETQFAKLDGVRIEMSEAGYHFLMWDDPQWLQAKVREFIAPAAH